MNSPEGKKLSVSLIKYRNSNKLSTTKTLFFLRNLGFQLTDDQYFKNLTSGIENGLNFKKYFYI